MSEITNFSMYKKKEDIITNHTLFLLSRLYNYSTDKFQLFINSLIENEDKLSTQIYFGQQKGTGKSIIDGVIFQESFKILIETKRGNNFTTKQIKRHLNGFENEHQKILLLIGSEPVKNNELEKLKAETVFEYNKLENVENGVKLINTTFNELIDLFEEVIEVFDKDMQELIEDFKILCEEQNLMNKKKTRMRGVPCGDSLELNIENNIYYMPSDRGYKNHEYIGLYTNKCIRAVGEIDKVSVLKCNTEEKKVENVEGDVLNNKEKEKILKVVEIAFERYGHKISENTRFFLVKDFYLTEYEKNSKYGMMGARYFDLSEILGDDYTDNIEIIAEKLKKYDW